MFNTELSRLHSIELPERKRKPMPKLSKVKLGDLGSNGTNDAEVIESFMHEKNLRIRRGDESGDSPRQRLQSAGRVMSSPNRRESSKMGVDVPSNVEVSTIDLQGTIQYLNSIISEQFSPDKQDPEIDEPYVDNVDQDDLPNMSSKREMSSI